MLSAVVCQLRIAIFKPFVCLLFFLGGFKLGDIMTQTLCFVVVTPTINNADSLC